MDELILVSYLSGFAAALVFALMERPASPWPTDFIVAALVALWPVSAVVAVGASVYRTIPRRP
jgi:hypothetical protein